MVSKIFFKVIESQSVNLSVRVYYISHHLSKILNYQYQQKKLLISLSCVYVNWCPWKDISNRKSKCLTDLRRQCQFVVLSVCPSVCVRLLHMSVFPCPSSISCKGNVRWPVSAQEAFNLIKLCVCPLMSLKKHLSIEHPNV